MQAALLLIVFGQCSWEFTRTNSYWIERPPQDLGAAFARHIAEADVSARIPATDLPLIVGLAYDTEANLGRVWARSKRPFTPLPIATVEAVHYSAQFRLHRGKGMQVDSQITVRVSINRAFVARVVARSRRKCGRAWQRFVREVTGPLAEVLAGNERSVRRIAREPF